jgi:drug/metabolite transporter (DMT)-like permease
MGGDHRKRGGCYTSAMKARVWIAFLALGLIWGTPYFFIKTAVHELSAVWVAWGRLLCAALLLVPIALWRGQLRGMAKHWRWLIVFALVELVGPFFLIAQGETWISSSLAGILLAGVPLMVVIVSPLMGVHEPVSGKRLAGLVTGLIGVVVLLGLDTHDGVHGWIGAGCILLAAVGYAVGPLTVQRHLAGADSLGLVAISTAIAAAVLTVPAIFTAPATVPSVWTIGSVVILGVMCTALALMLFVYVISNAGAARASVVTYINPAVALLLGVFLLDEHFGAGPMVGLALILFGSWLATERSKTKSGSPQSPGG